MAHTRLRYHLITATKGRQPLLLPEVEQVLYDALPMVVSDAGGHLYAAGGMEDHMHAAIAIKPTVAVSNFVCMVKTDTSRIIRAEFPDLNFRWQRSFGAFTVAPDEMEPLLKYIANQKQHHRRQTTRDIWECVDFR